MEKAAQSDPTAAFLLPTKRERYPARILHTFCRKDTGRLPANGVCGSGFGLKHHINI